MSCAIKPSRLELALARAGRHVEFARHQMHDYQDGENGGVKFLLDNPFSALFIDLGLGKTIISLTVILELVRRMELDRCLVIAPLRVANETWPTEIGKWAHTAPLGYHHIRDDDIAKEVNRAGKVAREAFRAKLRAMPDAAGRKMVDLERDHKLAMAKEVTRARVRAARALFKRDFAKHPQTVHIINREQVEFLVAAWGRDWPYKTVIIDESSSLKDHTTQRFKALAKVRPLITRMHQLTATPAAETYLHLFAQIYLLDLGKRFGKSYPQFKAEYFIENKYTYACELRKGAQQQITDKISDICLVMKAEDYLDLQKPVMTYHRLPMPAAAQALYDTMEKDLVVEVCDGTFVEAETAAALSQKLLQMASGVLYETRLVPAPGQEDVDVDLGEVLELRKTRVVHELHDIKIQKLRQLVEEANGAPLLVSYLHNSSRDRLREAFPQAVMMDRDGKCVAKWNKGKIPILLMHPQSGGHGLNLQFGGDQIVFYDIPWSLELYKQLIGRLARQGQLRTVVVHHLVAMGTLDEAVIEALGEKDESQEMLFKLLKALQRKYRKLKIKRMRLLARVCLDDNDEL